MGFDNECIVNIQSLAGEYFCPVCRLLVYPNEALQSQCTHLYCKPCLTYVVGTTRACPYDGYLVTEEGSKPLVENNKALAETIGKIAVRCLYQRSGCQWQGPLSDCTSHCSGCTFGNSPVVCNRCAVQIVHRQVQEHAQICSGVQPQATQTEGTQVPAAPATTASANGEQTQTATQSGASNTAVQTSQTGAAPVAGQDPNLLANVNTQVHGVAPGAVLTPEQLYQQQYQQYYQQYPGYDPYQQAYQNYYPYAQQPQVYPQAQAQVQTQPQLQSQQQQPNQSQMLAQAQVMPQIHAQPQSVQHVPSAVAPTQSQVAGQPPLNMTPQSHPPSQGYPTPQMQSHPQAYAGVPPNSQPRPVHPQSQQMQMPQYPQHQPQMHPHLHMPPQPYSQAHPQQSQQTLLPAQQQAQLLQAHPQHQLPNQPINPNAQPQTQQPLAHGVTGHQSYPQPQAHQQMPPGAQQRPNLHPQLPPHGQFPHQLPQMGGPQSQPPVPNQQHPLQLPPQGQVPNVPPSQRPVIPYAQQPAHPTHQHPAMHPMQQAVPQQHMQHQQAFPGQASAPIQNKLRPRGPHVQLPPPPPPPMHPQLHFQGPPGMHHQQSQNYAARPMMPNHDGQPQHIAHSPAGFNHGRPAPLGANQNLLNQNFQSHMHEKTLADRKNGSPSQKTAEIEPNGTTTEFAEAKNLKSGVDVKLGENEDANKQFEMRDKVAGAELHGSESAPEQPASNGGKSSEAVATGKQDEADASQQGEMKLDDSSKEQSGSSSKDAVIVGVNGANTGGQTVPASGSSAKSEATFTSRDYGLHAYQERSLGESHSHPLPPADQGRSLHMPLHQQRPAGPPMVQAALPPGPPHNTQVSGQMPSMLRPQGPGHLPGGPFPPPFARPPIYDAEGHISQQRPMNPVGTEVFPDLRSRYFDGQAPGAKSQGTETSITGGLQDERFKNFKDRGAGHNIESGAMGAPRFLPPYHPGGLNGAGDRASIVGIDGNFGRDEFAHNHPDFLGPAPAFGARPMDRFASRSPGGKNPGFPPRDFGGLPGFARSESGLENFEGHESRPFDGGSRSHKFPPGSAGNSFPESRFPHVPGPMRRGEHDGPGFVRGGDFIGEDIPGHLRRGEFQGQRNLPGHLRFGDDAGFGAFPGHTRRGHPPGPENFPHPPPFGEPFGVNMSRIGDRGFRSSFPPPGGLDPFENSWRKPSSNGWCRICKVDCEGVEGLELHSQTREHQHMAMDIVRSIKLQNAKKQKISNDRSSFDEPSKLRGTGYDVRGNKH